MTMLRKNDEITVTVERFGGEMGIAHLDGLTLFVQGALPGETVTARAQKVEKTHAFLKTLQVLTPSEYRVSPPCPYYEKCGGCVCQHMTYEASLQMKRERVRDALSRIGGLAVDVAPVIGMDDPWRYRNKTALSVGGEKGAPQIGFYAPRSHRIIDIDGCLIAKRESDEVSAILRRWMEKFQIEPYHEETRAGLIRHVMSRVSRSGQVMAVVVAATAALPHERELIAMMRAGVPGLCSLYLNVNRRGDNVILGPESHLLYGEERLRDTLCGLQYALSPQSFFQVNPVQTEKLYQTAVDFAELTGDELVADLYCGAGTISLLLARHAKKSGGRRNRAPGHPGRGGKRPRQRRFQRGISRRRRRRPAATDGCPGPAPRRGGAGPAPEGLRRGRPPRHLRRRPPPHGLRIMRSRNAGQGRENFVREWVSRRPVPACRHVLLDGALRISLAIDSQVICACRRMI